MKSIKRKFEKIQKRNPGWPSYVCFSMAIAGMKYNRAIIHRWFNQLVEKDDYCTKEKKAIMHYLESLSNDSTSVKNSK